MYIPNRYSPYSAYITPPYSRQQPTIVGPRAGESPGSIGNHIDHRVDQRSNNHLPSRIIEQNLDYRRDHSRDRMGDGHRTNHISEMGNKHRTDHKSDAEYIFSTESVMKPGTLV